MYPKKGKPSKGELVICRPKRIMEHSAILELAEYERTTGFLHISQVSKGWVKSISDHLQKDTEIACRVIKIDGDKIELSIKQVSKEASNSKMNDWRSEKKAVNIIKAVAKKIKKPEAQLEKEVVEPVMKEYGSIHAFIELLKQEGTKIIKELNIPEYWEKPILEYSRESVKKVQLKKNLEIHTTQKNGIELIKKILCKTISKNVEIKYISAPKYLLRVTSTNYKDAQKLLENAIANLENECAAKNIEFECSKK